MMCLLLCFIFTFFSHALVKLPRLSKDVSVKIFATGIVFCDLSFNDKVFKDTEPALRALAKNNVFSLLPLKSYLSIHNESVEFSLCLKSDVTYFSRAVPI